MRKQRISNVVENTHNKTNDSIRETAMELADANYVVKLDDLLKKRGMTQVDFSTLTGIRLATLVEFMNGSVTSINKTHLVTMIACLRITSISELIDIELPEHKEKQYKKEAEQWKEEKRMPQKIKDIYIRNVTRNL